MQIFYPNLKIKSKKLKIFFRWGITLCSAKHKYNVWISDILKVNYLSVELSSPFGFRRTQFHYGEIHNKTRIGFFLIKWGNYGRIYTKFKYKKINGNSNNNRRSKK